MERAVSQRCAVELLDHDYCESNGSCQLGVLAANDPSTVSSVQWVDPAAFEAGIRMQRRCTEAATAEMLTTPLDDA